MGRGNACWSLRPYKQSGPDRGGGVQWHWSYTETSAIMELSDIRGIKLLRKYCRCVACNVVDMRFVHPGPRIRFVSERNKTSQLPFSYRKVWSFSALVIRLKGHLIKRGGQTPGRKACSETANIKHGWEGMKFKSIPLTLIGWERTS